MTNLRRIVTVPTQDFAENLRGTYAKPTRRGNFGRFSSSRGNVTRHDHPTLSCLNDTNVIYNDKFTSTRPLTSV